MKKAQILSAIALAFALGVTPVIATANTVSAFTAADTTAKPVVQGSATQTDVNNAVAAVKANITYANMMTLKDVMQKFTDGDYAGFTITAGSNNNTTPDVINTLNEELTTTFKADTATILKDKSFVKQISGLVNEAEDTEYYSILAPLFAAVNANDGKGDNAAYRTALNNYNNAMAAEFPGFTKLNADSSVTTADFAAVKTSYTTAVDGANPAKATYDNYEDLYEAVAAAEEASDKYTNGKTALVNALQNSGVLTQAGLEALATELKADNVNLETLQDLVPDDTNGYNNWLNVETKVSAAEKGVINLDSNANYNLIIAIATALKTAEGNTTQTPAEIAATLVGYKAPAAQNTISEGPVTVTGAFPADYKLSVVKSDKKIAAFGDAKYAMWDINIVDKNNNKVNVEGSVMVTINVPEGFDAAKSSVYFVTAEGKVEKLAARVENGKMVFTTSHFSLYAIVEDNGKNFGIGAPDTGIVAGTENSASTTVAMVAGVATALTAAGAGVVAYRNARRSTRK